MGSDTKTAYEQWQPEIDELIADLGRVQSEDTRWLIRKEIRRKQGLQAREVPQALIDKALAMTLAVKEKRNWPETITGLVYNADKGWVETVTSDGNSRLLAYDGRSARPRYYLGAWDDTLVSLRSMLRE